MSAVRRVVTNAYGYREVCLKFRVARAGALETDKVHERKDRIHCPGLDASRTEGAYGMMALTSTDKKGLDQWSDALQLSPFAVRAIAYFSGPWYKIPYNILTRTFDDEEVNTGFIRRRKNDVHTDIIGRGYFDQDTFDNFVWTVHPDLTGTSIGNAFLHSEEAAGFFIGSDNLDVILAHNESKSDAKIKGFGPFLSRFEMSRLLQEVLGQQVTPDPSQPGETIDAISVQDMHDLYKYGVYPADIEDQLLAAGLIKESSVALTAKSETSA